MRCVLQENIGFDQLIFTIAIKDITSIAIHIVNIDVIYFTYWVIAKWSVI